MLITVRTEVQLLQSLILKPDGIHETKLKLSKGSPLSLPPSSCCLFFPGLSSGAYLAMLRTICLQIVRDFIPHQASKELAS